MNNSIVDEFDRRIEESKIREAKELEELITDWTDLGQLVEALKIGRISVPPKLAKAFMNLGPAAIHALILAYDDPDLRDYSHRVTPYILHFGVEAYHHLVQALNGENQTIRQSSVTALCSFRGDEVNSLFISLLDDHDTEIRKQALQFLKKERLHDLVGKYATILHEKDTTAEVTKQAAACLCEILK